jgi:hypothetical protein
MGDWHALYYRKNDTGGWLELYNLQDTNSGKKSTAGSIAFFSQRGQTRISESSLWTFKNSDGNSGPGPVPHLYSIAVPPVIPPTPPGVTGHRLLENGASRLLESGAFRLLEGAAVGTGSGNRLLESGAARLLEDGAFRLLEGAPVTTGSGHRLLESGAARLLESGAFRLLEEGAPSPPRTFGRRLLESGAARLLEDGGLRLLEDAATLPAGVLPIYPDPSAATIYAAIDPFGATVIHAGV